MHAPMPVIVGVPRSGTTLLRMMLDSHPAVAIPPETGFLPQVASITGPDVAADAARLITSFHTWPDFHLSAGDLRAALAAAPSLTAADAARTFYRLYAARFGKPRWGDKTPGYSGALPAIAALLPEARFVHVIRDGRDVAVSVRRLWFRPADDAAGCAADWAARIARTRALAAEVRHYHEVRYEDLVARPAATLRRLCDLLELAFDPAMLDYYRRAEARLAEHEGRDGSGGTAVLTKAQRAGQQRLVTEPPRIDRAGRWRGELTREEIADVERVAGEWLTRLGYGLTAKSV